MALHGLMPGAVLSHGWDLLLMERAEVWKTGTKERDPDRLKNSLYVASISILTHIAVKAFLVLHLIIHLSAFNAKKLFRTFHVTLKLEMFSIARFLFR